jgi:hypothetical protein
VDTVLVGGGLASAACALLSAAGQLHGRSKPAPARLSLAVPAVGTAAHAAMLVALTLYWRCFATRQYYRPHDGSSSAKRQLVSRPVDYFEHFHHWSDEEVALYAFGCVAGLAAWLLALAAAAVDWRAAAAAGAARPFHAAASDSCSSLYAASPPPAKGLLEPLLPRSSPPATPAACWDVPAFICRS